MTQQIPGKNGCYRKDTDSLSAELAGYDIASGRQPRLATPPGFEPRLNEPKSLVLPLHHGVAHAVNLNLFPKNANF